MAKTETDFRQAFGRMAPQAITNRNELAELLATSAGAIAQMVYRGELPPTAFLGKRRACWFVADIREWLDSTVAGRQKADVAQPLARSGSRIGRPRHSVEEGSR